MLKQHLQQKLQQKLSPQQLQVIRLLELPAIEIEERIKKELEENPALEEGKELPEGQDDISQDDSPEMDNGGDADVDISLGDYMSEDDIPEYKLREMSERAEKKEEIPFSGGVSLNSYLLEQLSVLGLPEKDEKIAEYIVGNIDDDGYLRRELSSIADDLVFQAGVDADLKDVERLLKVVQDFDPAGVGATDLQECLLLQLKRREQTEAVDYAEKVVESFFEDFSRKRYEKIMRSLNIDEDMMKRLNDFFRQFWELRKQEPQFAQVDEDTARAVVALLGGGCYCLLRQWILEDIQKTPQEIAAILTSMIRLPLFQEPRKV